MRVSSFNWLGALMCVPMIVGCGDDAGSGREDGSTGVSASSIGTDPSETSNSNGSQGDGDGDPGDGDGDGAPGDGDPGDGDADTSGGSVKWDVNAIPDAAYSCGNGIGGNEPDFSYIWIANSSQGTVTKLNTVTMVEEGRYWVRPDHGGSPSRTTVALSGNAAISARVSGGGVTKYWALVDDCEESNGMPGIQTSTGPNDILEWDVEECRQWHQPYVGKNYQSNRPMAWAPGEFNEGTCAWEEEKLWNSGTNNNNQTEVLLLNGDTGDIEETIPIPQMTSYMYGGAVDGEGNFWGLQNSSKIIRVDRQSFVVDEWSLPGGPGYGIAVDSQNRVWTCGGGHASRFDPMTQQWQSTPGASSGIGGCMTDGQGTLYHSRYSQGVIIAIDTDTVMPVQEYPIPAYVHGISVDFAGKVWGVTFASSQAFRLDPMNGTVDTYNGLIGAYTYSDMTGFGLSSVTGSVAQ